LSGQTIFVGVLYLNGLSTGCVTGNKNYTDIKEFFKQPLVGHHRKDVMHFYTS